VSRAKGVEVDQGEAGRLDEEEEEEVLGYERLSSRLVYEVIRRDGTEELERPASSLVWSGVAAGIIISFSIVSMAILRAHLPASPSRALIETLGYSFGFVIVILGRLQLFTENTITTVIPLMRHPTWRNFLAVARLWIIVLAANVAGTVIAAGFMAVTAAIPPDVLGAVGEISHHMMSLSPTAMFAKGIPAGILVAAIVWMLPSSGGNTFWVIVTFTWLIAAGGFTHVVAGSTEAAYLVLTGEAALTSAVFGFFLPVLAGNVVGGTLVFAMLAHAQVRSEIS
jgi:formate/nitrite transporter FocA (FNT family)